MQSSNSFIQHVHPLNWWVGMRYTELQILLHGSRRLDDMEVTIEKASHVVLKEVVKFKNKHYIIIYIDTQGAPAQTFYLRLKREGELVADIPYELKERRQEPLVTFDARDVVYLLMPDRFSMGEPYRKKRQMYAGMRENKWNRRMPYARHGGDMRGMLNHLDYLQELGVTAIWPTTLQENDMAEQSYHGYAITDYYRIDPRLGSNEDYRLFVEEAHRRGLKVVMDVVFNHCGTENFLFKDRPADDWFNFDSRYVQTGYKTAVASDVHASRVDRELTVDGWFTEQMPDFNGRNRYVADYLIQMTKWWVEYAGVNGFRQDTYPYNDYGLMKRWCHEMEEEYPGMNLVGETWLSDNVGVSYWQKNSKLAFPLNSELPTVMDFPLTFLMGSAVDEETDEWFSGLARLYAYLAQDRVYADVNHLLTFLSNHDIDRFQPTKEKARNVTRYKQALTLLLTLRGIPQLYVGDEIGMYAQKGDNDGLLRQDFPGGFPGDENNAFTEVGRNRLQNQYYNFTKKLLHWRKGNDVVALGSLTHYAIRNGCYVYARQKDGKTVTVVMNGTSEKQTLDLNVYREVMPAKKAYDVISGKTKLLLDTLTVPSRSFCVLEF